MGSISITELERRWGVKEGTSRGGVCTDRLLVKPRTPGQGPADAPSREQAGYRPFHTDRGLSTGLPELPEWGSVGDW